MEPLTLKSDDLKNLAAEAGFNEIDECDLYDVVFGACDCCCSTGSGGNNVPVC